MFGKSRQQDVLIVGAGPVGLAAAAALRQQDAHVRIVDEQWRTATHSYGLVLHPQTIELLTKLGLGAGLEKYGRKISKIAFYANHDRRAELDLGKLEVAHPYLLVMRQSMLENLLEDQLGKLGTKVEWNHRVTQITDADGPVVATVDKLEKVGAGYAVENPAMVIQSSAPVESQYVLGADGYRSVVRHMLGAEYDSVGAPLYYAVFEFECSLNVPDEVRIVIRDDDTNVLWPLPDNYCRWSFQLPSTPDDARREKSRLMIQLGSESFPARPREELLDYIDNRAPWFNANPGDINWSMTVRFEQRLVSTFGHKRCWLAGDAAHLAGPVGGQSMNVGIREAVDLAGRMIEITRRSAPRSMLSEYETDRLAEWRALFGAAGDPKSQAGTDSWVEANRKRLLPCIPASGDALRDLLGQLKLAPSW